MYFPFSELHGWGKIFAVQPKTNDSEVPQSSILRMLAPKAVNFSTRFS